jgi:hypothetical protein
MKPTGMRSSFNNPVPHYFQPPRPGTYGQIDHSSLYDQHQQPSFGGLMSSPTYGGGPLFLFFSLVFGADE